MMQNEPQQVSAVFDTTAKEVSTAAKEVSPELSQIARENLNDLYKRADAETNQFFYHVSTHHGRIEYTKLRDGIFSGFNYLTAPISDPSDFYQAVNEGEGFYKVKMLEGNQVSAEYVINIAKPKTQPVSETKAEPKSPSLTEIMDRIAKLIEKSNGNGYHPPAVAPVSATSQGMDLQTVIQLMGMFQQNQPRTEQITIKDILPLLQQNQNQNPTPNRDLELVKLFKELSSDNGLSQKLDLLQTQLLHAPKDDDEIVSIKKMIYQKVMNDGDWKTKLEDAKELVELLQDGIGNGKSKSKPWENTIEKLLERAPEMINGFLSAKQMKNDFEKNRQIEMAKLENQRVSQQQLKEVYGNLENSFAQQHQKLVAENQQYKEMAIRAESQRKTAQDQTLKLLAEKNGFKSDTPFPESETVNPTPIADPESEPVFSPNRPKSQYETHVEKVLEKVEDRDEWASMFKNNQTSIEGLYELLIWLRKIPEQNITEGQIEEATTILYNSEIPGVEALAGNFIPDSTIREAIVNYIGVEIPVWLIKRIRHRFSEMLDDETEMLDDETVDNEPLEIAAKIVG